MTKNFINHLRKIWRLPTHISNLVERIDNVQKAIGRVEARQVLSQDPLRRAISDYEFKVYSQWGEDGIIQFLIRSVEIKNKIFVEFGVEDYKESNTRFLLQNNNWSGLIIDGS